MPQVAEIMTRGLRSMSPSDTLQFAAQAMDELNVGTLPICEGDRVIGMVTDRDITVRGVAQGLAMDSTPLSDVMSQPVEACHENDNVEDVTSRMKHRQIRRLVVLDQQDRPVGILSLGDVAVKADPNNAGDALAGISDPAEPDRSGTSAASGAAGGGQQAGRMPS